MSYEEWGPYIPVAQRRAQAQRKIDKMKKDGKNIQPIHIKGRTITTSYWGKAWCNHLEQFSDYENRLPRGRTYVRNGSVCHLEITEGMIKAMVIGSSMYHLNIKIARLPKAKWNKIKLQCTGKIDTLLGLLQGKISESVMTIVSHPVKGLFPLPEEIKFDCDCPDWAVMCKHVAAVLYGVGSRLDEKPELLFLLRGVDQSELVSKINVDKKASGRKKLKGNMGAIFGIDMSTENVTTTKKSTPLKKHPVKTPQKKQAKALRPTGKTIVRLRNRFSMNYNEFAKLLGVSNSTITTWESKTGRLNLRAGNMEAIGLIINLNKSEAWKRLKQIGDNDEV